MFRNYLKMEFRNIRKHKLISSINIISLSTGITVFLLLFSYVWNELTFDDFHKQKENLYTLTYQTGSISGQEFVQDNFELIKDRYPEITNMARALKETVSIEYNSTFNKESVHFVDPAFLDMFTFPLEYGNSKHSLNLLNNIVISNKFSQKIFGNESPIGNTIMMYFGNKKEIFQVAGVLKVYPDNSSIQPDILIPFDNVYKLYPGGNDFRLRPIVFYELKSNTNVADLENKINNSVIRKGGNNKFKYHLSKFTDTHFKTVTFPSPVIVNSTNPLYSIILMLLAFGILFLACFNYMNLSLSNFSSRFKEVGVRKVIGAGKKSIISQFLVESVGITIVAFILSIAISQMLMPLFNQLSGKSLNVESILTVEPLGIILSLLIISSLAMGIYPAIIFSNVNTVDIFKGKTKFGGKKNLTRALIVLQFCIAVVLVTGTIIIKKQVDFIQTKNLGFDPKNVVIVKTFGDFLTNEAINGKKVAQHFKESLSSYPQIESVAGVYGEDAGTLIDDGISYYPYVKDGKEIDVLQLQEDCNYLNTIKAKILQGRYLSDNYATDKVNAAVVNESFIKAFGINDPIGKNISDVAQFKYPDAPGWGKLDAKIVGVVKDFNTGSLYHKIKPAIITYGSFYSHIAIRIAPGKIQESIELLKKTWKGTGISFPFTYNFFEDVIADQYQKEKRWNAIFGCAAFFAIFIAGMGLLGLTALSVAFRKKEIGVRKVLGAGLKNLILLLNREFISLVIISCILTWPVAFFLGNKWLENFEYKISIGVDILLYSFVIIMMIAIAAASYFTIKAALANPVNSLRSE